MLYFPAVSCSGQIGFIFFYFSVSPRYTFSSKDSIANTALQTTSYTYAKRKIFCIKFLSAAIALESV